MLLHILFLGEGIRTALAFVPPKSRPTWLRAGRLVERGRPGAYSDQLVFKALLIVNAKGWSGPGRVEAEVTSCSS